MWLRLDTKLKPVLGVNSRRDFMLLEIVTRPNLLNLGRMASTLIWPCLVLGIATMAIQYFYNFFFHLLVACHSIVGVTLNILSLRLVATCHNTLKSDLNYWYRNMLYTYSNFEKKAQSTISTLWQVHVTCYLVYCIPPTPISALWQVWVTCDRAHCKV